MDAGLYNEVLMPKNRHNLKERKFLNALNKEKRMMKRTEGSFAYQTVKPNIFAHVNDPRVIAQSNAVENFKSDSHPHKNLLYINYRLAFAILILVLLSNLPVVEARSTSEKKLTEDGTHIDQAREPSCAQMITSIKEQYKNKGPLSPSQIYERAAKILPNNEISLCKLTDKIEVSYARLTNSDSIFSGLYTIGLKIEGIYPSELGMICNAREALIIMTNFDNLEKLIKVLRTEIKTDEAASLRIAEELGKDFDEIARSSIEQTL